MKTKSDDRNCCRIAVDNARKRWKACGDTLSQEVARQIDDLQKEKTELMRLLKILSCNRGTDFCSECNFYDHEGHADTCPIGLALKGIIKI